ncbi:MAG: tRNA pseudouridine(55) synthase TruB [Cardiobacteriaceae bacterium]|nr:tRNA pseudouridine(55) synthase TruB [Cardiobacteriaceae bacterium]
MSQSYSVKKRALSGVLLFYKDAGVSSNQALQRVRYLYRAEKAGHGGTLDPFATGLLPILLGEASKFGHYLLDADKTYRVRLQFGFETDTQDLTGKPTRHAPIPDLKSLDWERELKALCGVQMQQPPSYSALKVDGKRAYELARSGEEVQLLAREIEIKRFELLGLGEDFADLEVCCSKGTYVRTLVQDLAKRFGSAGHASKLERVAVGDLKVQPQHHLQALQALATEQSALDALLLPLETCVAKLPRLAVPDEKIRYLINGNDVFVATELEGEVALYHAEKFLGVGEVKGRRVFPKRLCQRLE